jgi:hypothetical protein
VGNIERADVVLNSENKSKGHGTVLFATIEDAQRGIGKISIYKYINIKPYPSAFAFLFIPSSPFRYV